MLIKTAQNIESNIESDTVNTQFDSSESHDAADTGNAIVRLTAGSLDVGATIDTGFGAQMMNWSDTNRRSKTCNKKYNYFKNIFNPIDSYKNICILIMILGLL